MNKRTISAAVFVLVVVALGLYFIRRPKPSSPQPAPTASVEKNIEERFKISVPEDVDKAELLDVSGGTSIAIATKKKEDGKFIFTVLADLPDPEAGTFYQAWISKENAQDNLLLGSLRLAKGGYLFDFESSTDYSDYKKVTISQEGKSDKTLETRILEGSFK